MIGVFGLFFNLKNMMNNKLGVTFDTYKTGLYSDIGSGIRPVTDAERQIFQNAVERVYGTFTKRVADGRAMAVADVDSIGQGRVWSGTDAQQIGLVDVLGGLDDAIKIAAKKANVSNYRISELPEEKEPFKQIMEEVSGDVETRWIKYQMGNNYEFYQSVKSVLTMQGVQTRMMYNVVFE